MPVQHPTLHLACFQLILQTKDEPQDRVQANLRVLLLSGLLYQPIVRQISFQLSTYYFYSIADLLQKRTLNSFY
jgi:hypothetical protein